MNETDPVYILLPTLKGSHLNYQVDWAKDPELEESDIPTVEDCIESFLRLLENIHSKGEIAAYIKGGIQYSGQEP